MSGRIGLLSALLALQLVIIAAVLFARSGVGQREEGPFLELDTSAVDEIAITGEDDRTVTLTRADGGWRLPDGLPANAGKVSEVLESLAGLRSPWPVATSGGAAERFEVAEDAFQRRVVLTSGGDVAADLYLGTSPGYQQVHARRAGDDAVYSVGLSNYQLPAQADEWLDKTLLQPDGEVTAVERVDAWRLERAEEGWLLAGPSAEADAEGGAGVAADQDAAGELMRRIQDLRVTGVAEAPPEEAQPAAVLAVTDQKGTYRIRLYENEEGNEYVLSSERREGWFSLAGYLADQLLAERDSLLAAEEAEDAGREAEDAGQEAEDAGQEAEDAGQEAADAGQEAAEGASLSAESDADE